jgi:threonine dehydrogenase-like Zn-dependent dehydrogenase
MKAVIFNGPYDLRIEEVEKPAIGEHEVLIKVAACGICGSDLHMYKLNWYTDLLIRESSKGKIHGHEFSGEIVEMGDAVRGFKIGDRVCGVGFGALAEYVPILNVPGMTLMKLPDEVSYEEGDSFRRKS